MQVTKLRSNFKVQGTERKLTAEWQKEEDKKIQIYIYIYNK